ncbi:ComEC/Rec2 family competence protein [Halalkalibacter okhensis]|nr:MBL fold metallo-hydrolase [Halalkalibacter okhensis]
MAPRMYANLKWIIAIAFLLTFTYPLVTYIQAETVTKEEAIQAKVNHKEIFDETLHKGALQIRYFDLEADTKSGDAILIESPDGKRMLIDAGIVDTGEKLDHYLDQLNVNHLDIAVATHPHHDHIGGYHTLLKSKQIDLFIRPNLEHHTETYQVFRNLLREQAITEQFVAAEDRFTLGDHVEVEILGPSEEELIHAYESGKLSTAKMNDRSLVLKVTYLNHTFLFTGDIYKKKERELIKLYGDKLDVDVLHAPHHGDRTSSSQAFIDTVKPQHTIISANILQSKKVYNRYVKSGSNVYATSKNGTILLVSDGEDLTVLSEVE